VHRPPEQSPGPGFARCCGAIAAPAYLRDWGDRRRLGNLRSFARLSPIGPSPVVHPCPPTVRSFAQKVRTRPLSILPHGNIGLLTGADLLLLFLQVAFCRLYALLLFCLCFLEIAILDTCFIFSRMGRGLRVSAG
jgi:hypothetical protein